MDDNLLLSLTRALRSGSAQRIGGGKPPHPKVNCDKENETQLKGTPLSGALLTPASPQCNVSLNSVASTYSEFVRDLSKASNPKIQQHILNSTITKL